MTTTQSETTATVETERTGAEITVIDQMGMPATIRCDRCPAQAYVEVETLSGKRLDFCAHHYTKHEVEVVTQAKRVIDHRPFIQVQERRYKGQS